ncbi:MAG: hypothetical protein K0M50_11260 [Prolixibacteraceae bacterium]|nr:hypothetical protein [Prolixibacteraceae bacterium]
MTPNLTFMKLTFLIILCGYFSTFGQIRIANHPSEKTVVFGNNKIQMTLDYNAKCMVTEMKINGESILDDQSGIFSEIRTSSNNFSTRNLDVLPEIKVTADKVIISNIHYGNGQAQVNEVWTFCVANDDIKFNIDRTVPNTFTAEEVAFPSVNFKNIRTWDGAFLDYGGLAWFYLFNEKLCTYGVHSGSPVFWNSTTGNGLKVSASAPGKEIASKFTRSGNDLLVYNVSVSDSEMKLRYDADTKRRRFLRGKTDVWDPVEVSSGKYSESVTFAWLDYNKEYDRGHLAGIDGKQVSNLVNTIARIGVIDAKLFGGNSWHTPYGPICLHEQYIGQLGIAINDPNYLKGYMHCLDYYRDNAIQPDGRVLSRWAYTNEDAMAGTATPKGFYEAQWGYLMDSNPDFVSDVAILYNQNGDLNWVRTHKESCENALEYMLKRDSNRNHLVEMMTDSHTEKRGSDWIDIIWASYENAFVNAKLYYALTLWSDIEKQLGDQARADYYLGYALELKTSFNKSTESGGFWDNKNKWYVHWVDKDRSVHGNNLVVPVNFMAIAYGICDDQQRKTAILDQVEEQMQKENLFAWPLCMYSYAPGEGNDWQFPFPNYENGDIFLSWGAVGVEAYASYKPELALKYVENILSRYKKDGLAFQRYGRVKQEGLGDDILSGNSLAIVGLYNSIYGINPMYNRMYLNPHLPEKLMGTILKYTFRGESLEISLDKDHYSVSDSQFKLSSKTDFGFNTERNELEYYNSNNDACSLKAKVINTRNLSVEIVKWDEVECSWNQILPENSEKLSYSVFQVKANKKYVISIDGQISKTLNSDNRGRLEFNGITKPGLSEIRIHLLNE